MYTDNYTGPYYSNGQLQESVPFGTAPTDTFLASQSRLHDTAYATYPDELHRRAADDIYYHNLKGEGIQEDVAAKAVKFGNEAARGVTRLGENVLAGAKYGPLGAVGGLIYTALGNIFRVHQMLPGGAYDKAKRDIHELYSRDPHPELQMKPKTKSSPIPIPNRPDTPVYNPPTHMSENLLYYGDPSMMAAWKKHRSRLYTIMERKPTKVKRRNRKKNKVCPSTDA